VPLVRTCSWPKAERVFLDCSCTCLKVCECAWLCVVFPQQQKAALDRTRLAPVRSSAVPDKVPEYLVRFRKVPEQRPCEVPEGSGADAL